MIAEDLQNAAVSLLADNPDKMPQTDDASAQFMNAFSSVLIGYTNRGILATAKWRGTAVGRISTGDYIENGFALWADSYDNQSEADRAAHRAVPIQWRANAGRFAGIRGHHCECAGIKRIMGGNFL